MKLNLRRPTLVLTGYWNPAIFQPPWVAVTLLGVPPGKEVNFVEVVEAGKVAHYFGDIGICVPPGRLELYSNVASDQKWEEIEQFAIKVLETLPHTPLQGLGINFQFQEENPEPEVVDKLWTHEDLETRFEVAGTVVRSALKFEDYDLNFSREVSVAGFAADFNFHHADVGLEKLKALIPGSVKDRYERAKKILLDVYGIETESAVLAHDFPAAAAA